MTSKTPAYRHRRFEVIKIIRKIGADELSETDLAPVKRSQENEVGTDASGQEETEPKSVVRVPIFVEKLSRHIPENILQNSDNSSDQADSLSTISEPNTSKPNRKPGTIKIIQRNSRRTHFKTLSSSEDEEDQTELEKLNYDKYVDFKPERTSSIIPSNNNGNHSLMHQPNTTKERQIKGRGSNKPTCSSTQSMEEFTKPRRVISSYKINETIREETKGPNQPSTTVVEIDTVYKSKHAAVTDDSSGSPHKANDSVRPEFKILQKAKPKRRAPKPSNGNVQSYINHPKKETDRQLDLKHDHSEKKTNPLTLEVESAYFDNINPASSDCIFPYHSVTIHDPWMMKLFDTTKKSKHGSDISFHKNSLPNIHIDPESLKTISSTRPLNATPNTNPYTATNLPHPGRITKPNVTFIYQSEEQDVTDQRKLADDLTKTKLNTSRPPSDSLYVNASSEASGRSRPHRASTVVRDINETAIGRSSLPARNRHFSKSPSFKPSSHSNTSSTLSSSIRSAPKICHCKLHQALVPVQSSKGPDKKETRQEKHTADNERPFFHMFQHSFVRLSPAAETSDTAIFDNMHTHAVLKDDLEQLRPPHHVAERLCEHLQAKTSSRFSDSD